MVCVYDVGNDIICINGDELEYKVTVLIVI